jgi:hypothetical protein
MYLFISGALTTEKEKLYVVYVNINGTERYYETNIVGYYPNTVKIYVEGKPIKLPKASTIVELKSITQRPIPKMFNIFGVYKREGEI